MSKNNGIAVRNSQLLFNKPSFYITETETSQIVVLVGYRHESGKGEEKNILLLPHEMLRERAIQPSSSLQYLVEAYDDLFARY